MHVTDHGSAPRGSEAASRRIGILIWATAIGLLLGLLGLGDPLEISLRAARDAIASHSVSGNIVVVAIDDRSLDEIGKWPWPRRYYGGLTDALLRGGAAKILFDLDLSGHSTVRDDQALRAALARAGGRATLAASFTIDPVDGERHEVLPLEPLRSVAQTADINFRYNFMGAVTEVPYAVPFRDGVLPSFASVLADRAGKADSLFPIDYSLSLRSVPVFSAIDVLQGRVPAAAFAGKQVVIGSTSDLVRDSYMIFGQGFRPGVYVHVLAAETLMEGRPVVLGWLLPFVVALLCAIGALSISSVRPQLAAFASAGVLIQIVAFALERAHIYPTIVPGLLVLAIAGSRSAWLAFRLAYRRQGSINKVTGLPNLHALRLRPPGEQVLIAARVNNFAQIAAALATESERAFAEQIVDRLRLGATGQLIYQGDEGIFAWFLDPAANPVIGDHLDALHTLFRSPVILEGSRIDLSVSFGVDASGAQRTNHNRLGAALVAADEAAAEGLRWKLYDASKLADSAWRLSLLSQLDAGIDSGEIWIAYQPKVDARSGTIIGAEALARWTHPDKGPISPADFVPIAEQSNRIGKLTLHVLERAIRAAASVNAAAGRPFGIAVNLSPRALDMPGLVDTIALLLDQNGLAPERLTLEVTETATIASGASLAVFERLCALGVRLSIDDYGTGLSTLDYLKRIPATEIKIDKSFVQALDRSHGDRLMVNSTIQLVRSLGRSVVAEGVERAEERDALQAMGCDVMQGYLFGRPMPLDELIHLVRENGGQVAA